MNDVIKYLPPYVASSNAFLKQKMVVFAVIFLKTKFHPYCISFQYFFRFINIFLFCVL